MRPQLLYDDDCSVCTIFAKFFRRLLHQRVDIVPMHAPHVRKRGELLLGSDYWLSFHIVRGDLWTSELEAIDELARSLPLGKLYGMLASLPPIRWVLLQLLRHFQRTRRMSCVRTP